MSFQTRNPANNSIIANYEYDSGDEVLTKLDSSHEAYVKWSKLSLGERINKIQSFSDLLTQNIEPASILISQEMGKPQAEAIAEIRKCILMITYYCEHSSEFLKEKSIDSSFPNSTIVYCSQGIILGIMPWNFPFWQVLRFAIPTLLLGNSVLIKHAPNVQGTQNLIQGLADRAFGKNGPLQTLIADIPQLESVIADTRIRGVSFTGSETAGKSVAQLCAKYLKKSVLELGGSDAYIVLKDAELATAAEACVNSRFLNCGQSCVAAKRWIVDESIHDEFLELVIQRVSKLKKGDPLEKETSLGPMARIDLKEKLRAQVDESLKRGAKVAYGDYAEAKDHSCFFPPIILTAVTEKHPVFFEETFGPVACITKARSAEHAIALANNSKFGLGGAIFSKDKKTATRIAKESLDTGGVFINDFYKSGPELPFGGVKSSGIGRELSFLALYEFANIKTLSITD